MAINSLSLLEKLHTGSKDAVYNDIMNLYAQQGRGIISFLYFANVMHHRLLEPASKKAQTETAKKYKFGLETADFLLPDGIALQWFAKLFTKKAYENLNGTDFIPYVFDQLIADERKVHLAVYGVYDEKIGKTQEMNTKALSYITDRRGITDILLKQDVYQERGVWKYEHIYEKALEESDADIHILLVCTGTPHQEIRTQQHRDFFEKHNILVFNAGGILDYRSGFEQRAPDRVVKARVLETPWRIAQHPKKNAKKLWWMFGIFRWWISRRTG